MSGGSIAVAVEGGGNRRFTPPWRLALSAAGARLTADRPDVVPDIVFVIEAAGAAAGPARADRCALVLADPPAGAGGGNAVIRTIGDAAEAGATRLAPFVDAEAVHAAARDRARRRLAAGLRLQLPSDQPWLLAAGPPAEEGEAAWQDLARVMVRLVMLDWRLLVLADPGTQAEAAAALATLPRERVRVLADEEEAATLGVIVCADIVVAPGSGRAPLALLQGLIAGIPAAAIRGSPAGAAIADGITGMLAAAGNPASFANVVGFLLRQRGFRQAFAANALKRSFDDHDLAAPAHELGHVLRDALRNAGRHGPADRSGGMLGDQG